MDVEVVTFQDWKKEQFSAEQVVVTVSKSATWSRGLSPFFLGPCPLYDAYISRNMENAWQYSKVYPEHATDGNTNEVYWAWAESGWNSQEAHRYPMGRGRIPLFSLWKVNGNFVHLSYVEARKHIYIPLYYKAVKDTEAFKKLKEKYEQLKNDNKDLYLVDFDAYRHHQLGMNYTMVINDSSRKMGHAFVLAYALEDPYGLKALVDSYT